MTGLRVKSWVHAPRFWWLAVPAMQQATRAPGNLHVSARTVAGVHHTLSAWVDEAAMRRFLVTGAHLKAMKAFATIATGRTYGFTADKLPDWDTALSIWMERSRAYRPAGQPAADSRITP